MNDDHLRLNDAETKMLVDAGMLENIGEKDGIMMWKWIPGSPKYIQCPECKTWLQTHEGGDFSLLFCEKCQVNWIHPYGNSKLDQVFETLELVRNERAANTIPTD